MLRQSCWCLVLAAALGLPGRAVGTTLRVPSEFATIQAGIDAAASGDTVLVAPGIYTDYEVRIGPFGTGQSAVAHLKGGVSLLSEGGPDVTTMHLIAGEYFLQVVWGWNLSEETWVEGFTITTPLAGAAGAELRDGAKATFTDCIFRDIGTGLLSEGGLAGNGADLDVIGCRFTNINAAGGGLVINGRLFLDGCWFEGCGPAGAVRGVEDADFPRPRSALVRNTTFLNNYKAAGGGGAMYFQNYNPVEVVSCRFEGNVSAGSAGAFANAALNVSGTLLVHDNVFSDNHARGGGHGGAIYVSGGPIDISGNTFWGCSQEASSPGGAAAFLQGGTVHFHNNVVSNCYGAKAVTLYTGTVVNDCNVFWSNPDGDIENFNYGPNDRVVDPEFCDPESGDFSVNETSPCLPENSGPCGLIGALGQGCGQIAVEAESWGQIKNRYRGEVDQGGP